MGAHGTGSNGIDPAKSQRGFTIRLSPRGVRSNFGWVSVFIFGPSQGQAHSLGLMIIIPLALNGA